MQYTVIKFGEAQIKKKLIIFTQIAGFWFNIDMSHANSEETVLHSRSKVQCLAHNTTLVTFPSVCVAVQQRPSFSKTNQGKRLISV